MSLKEFCVEYNNVYYLNLKIHQISIKENQTVPLSIQHTGAIIQTGISSVPLEIMSGQHRRLKQLIILNSFFATVLT